MTAFLCFRSDLHPYECGGVEEACIHCRGEKTEEHDPYWCALCNYNDEAAVERIWDCCALIVRPRMLSLEEITKERPT